MTGSLTEKVLFLPLNTDKILKKHQYPGPGVYEVSVKIYNKVSEEKF